MVLFIISIVIFGSRGMFSRTHKNVLSFEGSVKGLKVGAPVVFRGVQIGQVTDIVLEVDMANLTGRVPVYIEIYQDSIVPLGGPPRYDEDFLQALINRGLRAQLQPQSLLTGQLMINLDFHPESPIRLVDPEQRFPEIPTIPSGMEQLTRKLEDLPIESIANRLDDILAKIDGLLDSGDLAASLGSLNQFLKSADGLVTHLDSEIGVAAADIGATTGAARSLLAQTEKTLRFDEGVPGQIASGLTGTLAAAQRTLEETHKAVESVNGITAQNANLGYEMSRALDQITELSRSMRVLADYLERHPEALIRGKRHDAGD
ncbi:MAG TPA: MlaD family protein [Gemmatimonadales bacterium]|nr:MlaD family protein [Gemmatimonadales bacterium]